MQGCEKRDALSVIGAGWTFSVTGQTGMRSGGNNPRWQGAPGGLYNSNLKARVGGIDVYLRPERLHSYVCRLVPVEHHEEVSVPQFHHTRVRIGGLS